MTCDEEGEAIGVPCGADRCAADAPVAQCVPADALPCVPGEAPDTCQNGRLITCEETAGYLLTRACESGAICVGEGRNAGCKALDEIRCDPNTFIPLCVDGQRIECGTRPPRLVQGGRCQ